MHPLPTQMHMDARSRKHSEITQTVYDPPPIFTFAGSVGNRALTPDEWDVADRASQRAGAAAAAAATHPRESECTLPTTTRPASEPSSAHCPRRRALRRNHRVCTAHDDAPGVGTIECALPTTTRLASEPSSVHAPKTLPPATSATRVSSLPSVSRTSPRLCQRSSL